MSVRSRHPAVHSAILALAVVAALCTGRATAQPVDDEAVRAGKELIAVMRATDQIKQLLPNIMQMMKPAIVQGRPDVEKDLDVLIPVLLDGMSTRVGELTDQMATLYARNFTADEIRQMTAFYRSPVGQKFLEKMPVVAQQSMALGQAFGQRVASELQTRMTEELRKRGHDITPPK
jgi:uncharacterized protein